MMRRDGRLEKMGQGLPKVSLVPCQALSVKK